QSPVGDSESHTSNSARPRRSRFDQTVSVGRARYPAGYSPGIGATGENAFTFRDSTGQNSPRYADNSRPSRSPGAGITDESRRTSNDHAARSSKTSTWYGTIPAETSGWPSSS